MPKMDLMSYLLPGRRVSVEKILIEIKLFDSIYKNLMENFKNQYRDYLELIKFDKQDEPMFYFIKEIINDILSTEEYSLSGIANHTGIPEEVLYDIISGINPNPTIELSRKLFQLHMMVRRSLYDQAIQELTKEYSEHTKKEIMLEATQGFISDS